MKAYTQYLTMNIPSKMAFENITHSVQDAVTKSGVKEGMVLVKATHTTLLARLPRSSGPGPGRKTA